MIIFCALFFLAHLLIGSLCTAEVVLEARFSKNGIIGSVLFTQVNSTTVHVVGNFEGNVSNINATISTYPVKYDDNCETASGDVLFDFNDLTSEKLTTSMDINTTKLILAGPKSILGASVTVNKGNAMACATILPKVSRAYYAVVSISNSKIAGSFELLQGNSSDTFILGQISHSDGSNTTNSTTHLKWVVSNSTKSVGKVPICPENLAAYNPEGETESKCTSAQEDTCIVGDMSAKHGTLQVGVTGNKMKKGVDKNLPLYGEHSVLDRYLVIGDGNNKVLGCGIIKRSGPLNVQAAFTAAQNEGVSGSVAFKQVSPYHATDFSVNLNGLAKRTGGYHVHLYPIADWSKPSCSAASVGGHLNPFSIVQADSPPPGKGSMDKYEVGDLSGKFGLLTGLTSYSDSFIDENLPLFGYNTIVGRSVVIHYSTVGAPRMTCADILPVNGVMIGGVLAFEGSSRLKGFMTVRQYEQANKILTPTIFVVDLKNASHPDLTTKEHNFHVHIDPVRSNGACESGHYNPANVNVTKPPYNLQCGPNFPNRCELGDTSGKVGTYDIGSGKRAYADSGTPLVGAHTIFGRSVVVHAKGKTLPRLACADIVPLQNKYAKYFSFKGENESKDENRLKKITDFLVKGLKLESEPWKVSYPRISTDSTNSKCYNASFYLLDSDPSSYEETFKELIKKEEEGVYEPCDTTDSSSFVVSSVLLLVTSSVVLTLNL